MSINSAFGEEIRQKGVTSVRTLLCGGWSIWGSVIITSN